MKFPALLHVIVEGEEGDDAPWLNVFMDGVASIDEAERRVAIYKLVDEGIVSIQKQFVSKRRKK